MATPKSWVPTRWPGDGAPGWWRSPAALDLLKDTAINCIIAAGALPPAFVEAAYARAITLVTLGGGAGSSLPAIPAVKADELEKIPAGEVLALDDAVWPRIPMKTAGGSGGAHGGPTGNAWIDSNGWAVDLLAVKAPGRRVWVPAEPSAETLLRAESYQLAIADAATHGARWPIALDAKLRDELAQGDARARETWTLPTKTLAHFEAHPAPAGPAAARLGVCSDFAGANAFLANEVLNLAARRLLPYRTLEKDLRGSADLKSLRAVIWVDEKAPEGAARKRLDGFVREGGTLILPASAAHMSDGLKPAPRQDHGYGIYVLGQGRLAVAKQPWTDPYLLAGEAHMLLGRRHDVVRMWNAGTCMARYSESEQGGRADILNYAGRLPAHRVSLYVARLYRSARYTCLDGGAPRDLEVTRRDEGVEVQVPTFPVYATIEFGV